MSHPNERYSCMACEPRAEENAQLHKRIEDAKIKIINVIARADGGCENCVTELLAYLHFDLPELFPLDFIAKHALVYGKPVDMERVNYRIDGIKYSARQGGNDE